MSGGDRPDPDPGDRDPRGGSHRAVVPPGRKAAQRGLVGLVVLLLLLGLGTAGALTAPTLARDLGLPVDAAAVDPPGPVEFRPRLVPVAADAPAPTPAGVAAALDGQVGALGELSGVVVDPAAPQTPLWTRNPGEALVPASSTKLLTTSAALLALDPGSRWATTVVAGPTPGSVVLVGGGDPTLSSLPAGQDSVYPGAARLDDLAAQVRAARGPAPLTTVYVDDRRYSGGLLAPGWDPVDIAGGNLAPMVPAMLDGGRVDPTDPESERVADPTQVLGRALGRRLDASVSVEDGSAPPEAPVLGRVESPTSDELVSTALSISDNVLAEALGREVARTQGLPASFAGATEAVGRVLAANGVDTGGVRLSDTSGLSTGTRIPAAALAAVLAPAAAPGGSDPRTPDLRPILDGLPVAGGGGTLFDRYLAGTPNADGRGFVRAKTGTLTGTNALAGVVTDVDGRVLVFAFLSNGPDPSVARPGLDALATSLRECGCR